MHMLAVCSEPGCTTLVFGDGVCLQHEHRRTRAFVRGRPFSPVSAARSRLPVFANVARNGAPNRTQAPLTAGWSTR
jgi:hypothetical protein